MNGRKYPISLFIIGFITNMIFHFFWLFVPAIILLIVGIFVKPCLFIGLDVLLIDVIASFIGQLIIRKTCIEDSDNPDFRAFQDTVMKDGNWRENMAEYIEQKMQDPENKIESDSESEDE